VKLNTLEFALVNSPLSAAAQRRVETPLLHDHPVEKGGITMTTPVAPHASVRDPVCGMEITPEQAAATRTVDGSVLYFCSNDCAAAFDSNPAHYVRPAPPTASIAPGAAPARLALPMADLQRAGAPALERALTLVPGVARASVNIKGQQLIVDYDPAQASTAALLGAVRAAGFRLADQSLRLKVSGLYCANCIAWIEDAVKAVPGVLDATMSTASNEVRLDSLARQHGAAAAISVGLAPGLTNLLAKHCVERLGALDTLDIGILLGLGEAHGAAAIRWTLERMGAPFTLWHDGVAMSVAGFDTARRLRFPGRYGWRRAYRFDFADQHIIAQTLGVPRVSTWLCFDSAAVTRAVALLGRVGALRALRRASVRDRLAALLARVHVGSDGFAISVMTRRGEAPPYTCGLSGRGQSHATGVVAALVARQLYTAGGPPGVLHIEQRFSPDAVFQQLGADGIRVTPGAPPAG
jgi:YHS domain-containing protein/copper chaperone CopZ